MKLLIIISLASVLALARADVDVDLADSIQDPVVPELEARVVAAYSTRTLYTLTTTTATAVLTCRQASQTNTCQRRRKRSSSYRTLNVANDDDSALHSLGGTLDELPDVLGESNSEAEKTGRLGLTIWTSTSSTFTVTLTSTNTAITFSISYFCSYPGVSLFPAC